MSRILFSLKIDLENISVLKFKIQNSPNKTPFLDINIQIENNRYITSVYTKDTNKCIYLHGDSECPHRYKMSVVKSLLRRAFRFSATNVALDKEIHRIKQTLIKISV